MFSNCDQKKKMPIISSLNSNPLANMQNKNMIVASSSQHQQQQLKCPRCDSSNTKFCYYNNYSLSQPRHFCKACKRYWTRGGTLRNVPVGGSYRKNKRVKRPATPTATAIARTTSSPSLDNPHQISNPFFYSCNNLPSRFSDSSKNCSSSRLESEFLSSAGFNGLGLGLPHHMSHDHIIDGSSFINNSGLFGSSSSSSLLQHPNKPTIFGGGQSHLQTLASFHVGGNNDQDMNKEGQISENIMSSSSLDPSSNYNSIWNNASVVNGAWLDPTNNNVGSSLTSLI